MTRQTHARACALLVLLLLGGERAAIAATKQVKTTFSLSYHQCERPTTVPPCVAARPEDCIQYPDCEEWGLVNVYTILEGELDDKEYRKNKAHAPRFLRAVLSKIYGMPPEAALAYVPAKVATLYANPQLYGWLELPGISPGAVVIDRKKAAIITEEDDPRSAARRGAVSFKSVWRDPKLLLTLLHPSARHDGHLRESQARYFFTGAHGTPKVIVPINFLQSNATPGPFSYGADPRPRENYVPPGYESFESGAEPLAWNTWVEKRSYEQVTRLEPKTSYRLMVHLAPFAYQGVTARGGRPPTTTGVVAASKLPQPALRLRLLPLVNTAYLQLLTKSPVELNVDVERFKAWSGERPKGDELTYLQGGGRPTFVFGAASVAVLTTEREGSTSIELSVWDDAGWPIDEISIPVCIAAPGHKCDLPPSAPSYAGIDAVRNTRPAAAMHVVSMDNSVAGIFRRNDDPNAPYHIWKLNKPAVNLQQEIAGILNDFSTVRSEDFARHGERLYNVLFDGATTDNDSARAARAAFEAFAAPIIAGRNTTDASFYVRFLADEPSGGRILPLGAAKMPGYPDGYLGFHFRIETPLSWQHSTDTTTCIGEWSFVVPSAASPRVGPLRTRLNTLVPHWLRRSTIYETMRKFRGWIDNGRTTTPAGILLVSHHEKGKLVLDPDDFLAADEVQRMFAAPTIAVLNACGTATGGAENFVAAFNKKGVDTIIATKYPVAVDMAADFVQCFESALPAQRATSIGETYFKTIQCLRNRNGDNGKPYGAAALAYTLLGNTNANLCPRPGALAKMERNAH